MKKMNVLLPGISLLAFLFLTTHLHTTSSLNESNIALPNGLNATCIVDLGENVNLQLGDSIQIDALLSCQPTDIQSIEWESTGQGTISCTDCLDPFVLPEENSCYTITITWADGCVSTDEVCVFLQSCSAVFSENAINSVSPEQISDEATIELEITRTQFVHIEIVDDGTIEHVIWEGWLKKGLKTLSLDFSSVPAGTHDLQVRLYPETITTSIQKL